MEELKNIFQIIIIIGVGYVMHLSIKAQREERKEYMAKLRAEGKLSTPKQTFLILVAVFGGIYATGILITLVKFYIEKKRFLLSDILSTAFATCILEVAVASVIAFVVQLLMQKRLELKMH